MPTWNAHIIIISSADKVHHTANYMHCIYLMNKISRVVIGAPLFSSLRWRVVTDDSIKEAMLIHNNIAIDDLPDLCELIGGWIDGIFAKSFFFANIIHDHSEILIHLRAQLSKQASKQ